MKTYKRVLAFLLTAVMIFAGIPFTGLKSMASTTQYVFPVTGGHSISQYFSSSHGAIDVANCAQQPVVATATGTVIRVDNNCQHTNYSTAGCTAAHNSTCGNCVYIKHDDTGYVSVYGHLYPNSICVSVGEKVQAGQQIGLVGSSGMSTGFHLHFEIRPYANDYNNWYRDSENVNVNPSACSYIYLDSPKLSFPVDLGADFYAVILNTNYWKPITYNSKDENKSVTLTNAITTSEQLWRFIRQNDGSYVIYSAANGNVMEMDCGRPTSGNPVIAQEYWAGEYQKWFIYNHNNGYIIQSKHYYDMNLVLTLDNNNSADGTRITTAPRNDSSSQFWSIYSQDDVQLKSPILSVTVGDSSEDTVFTWNDGCGESHYNLRIWQDGVNSGIEYHTEWMASSGAGIQLPAGTYQAYVDAVNHYQCIASNFVTFTVADKYYSVSYDANGGSGAPAMQNKPYGKDIILDSATPNRTNYNFIGWNTKADGTGKTYQPGDIYTENADVTLYAMWELAHTHSYTSSVTKQPTCTEKGIRKYTCSSCGDTYTEDIAALGHNHIGSVTEPTCTEQGFTTYTCSRCKDSYIDNYTNSLNHPSSTWYTAVNPTATANGLAEKRCDYCDHVLDQFVIPNLNPDYVTGISLSSQKETVEIGDVFTLTASVIPDTAKNKNVIWSSRNPDIVTVDNGVVRAVKPGTTAIVAESEDGGFIDFCLVRVVSLVAINGAVIDNDSNIIYGLTCNLNSVDDYLEPVDNNMSISLSTATVGTGTTISIIDNGEVIDSYEAIIFGDVNGDGWYDGEDAFLVNLIVAGLLTEDKLPDYMWTAADCNHDGVIDEVDVDLLMGAGVRRNDIDQNATQAELATQTAYIEYASLIDQSAGMSTGIIPEPDTDDIVEDTTVPEISEDVELNEGTMTENENSDVQPYEPVEKADIEVIFANIFEFIKKILSFIFSFII